LQNPAAAKVSTDETVEIGLIGGVITSGDGAPYIGPAEGDIGVGCGERKGEIT
jgi:hypothetical protein